jgi:hypothetical protein
LEKSVQPAAHVPRSTTQASDGSSGTIRAAEAEIRAWGTVMVEQSARRPVNGINSHCFNQLERIL